LRSRTDAVRSLQAVLSITYESSEFEGTFSAVCNYQAPRRMRITAFKDIVIGTRPIFDMLFTEKEYAIDVAEMKGTKAVHDLGKLKDFPAKHPRFASFYWAGEAIFLPGLLSPDASVAFPYRSAPNDATRRDPWRETVKGKLPTGAEILWYLDTRRLEILWGYLTAEPATDSIVSYSAYRADQGAFIPTRVILCDGPKMTVTCKVEDLEVNIPLDPSIFSPDSVGEQK